ncbi:MAG: ParB/RepB/Spo0J family partition protein [Chloroflexi bacterium]|nr:ParB/RepB/Spo0J family partition protein [Chloroflexota bacterium]
MSGSLIRRSPLERVLSDSAADTAAYRQARLVPTARLRASAANVRQTIDPSGIAELAGSIRDQGLLQPLVVRREGDGYVIIAGHRRWEACQRLGWEEVPCIIRETTAEQSLEQQLIENIQREDIPPLEEAHCLRDLMQRHGLSLRELAARVHKSLGYLDSRLKLLKYADLAERVRTAKIPVRTAEELAKVEDAAERRRLTDAVLRGELGRPRLKEEVRRLRQRRAAPARPSPADDPWLEAAAELGEAPGAVAEDAPLAGDLARQAPASDGDVLGAGPAAAADARGTVDAPPAAPPSLAGLSVTAQRAERLAAATDLLDRLAAALVAMARHATPAERQATAGALRRALAALRVALDSVAPERA